ncbi:GNAT family N-acetyltransferase [Nocardia takedensis]
MAENAAGEIVGDLWIGPDPREATGTERSAWLYDIYVFEPFRRRGYGSAVLAAANG